MLLYNIASSPSSHTLHGQSRPKKKTPSKPKFSRTRLWIELILVDFLSTFLSLSSARILWVRIFRHCNISKKKKLSIQTRGLKRWMWIISNEIEINGDFLSVRWLMALRRNHWILVIKDLYYAFLLTPQVHNTAKLTFYWI